MTSARVIALLTAMSIASLAPAQTAAPVAPPLRMAVLGDSDSQGFQDTVAIPADSGERGGRYRPHTLQWTEVLAALRPQSLDLGPREATGSRVSIARLAGLFGQVLRTPRKLDHRYNFAMSGADCDDLMGGRFHQAPSLAKLIAADPAAWRDAVVVIRIGINVLGATEVLDGWAGGETSAVTSMNARADACTAAIGASVDLLRREQGTLRIVLVGILNNADWARYFRRWQSPEATRRIAAGLDRFDDALRRRVAVDPRLAFSDDRAWFLRQWGGRDDRGRPAYRRVQLADGFEVANQECDEPRCAVLADGHAGLVWNTLWAQSLIDLMNARWGLGIAPMTDAEVARFVRGQVDAGH